MLDSFSRSEGQMSIFKDRFLSWQYRSSKLEEMRKYFEFKRDLVLICSK